MKDINIDIIDTPKQVGDLVDWLTLRHTPPGSYKPTMYIDLEGVNLCREGSISIFTLLLDTQTPTTRVCLIDVCSLGSQAFNTAGARSKTLADILEDEKISKVFFDVRNDSDALFAHFGVALHGVEDVQLMESATRTTSISRKYLNGLAKCVESYGVCGKDLASWKLAKKKGEQMFKTEYGGSYEIFTRRPIPDDIASYCVGDVQYLPALRDRFWNNTNRWRDLVNDETKKRIAASQKPDYLPHGPNRTLAPWSKEQNKTLDEWNRVPTSGDYFNDDYFDDNLDDPDDLDEHFSRNDFDDWTRAPWQGPPS